jgi:hypothetical protein
MGGANHAPMPNPTSLGSYYDTALGDFNHDGKLDIVAVGDSNLQVFKQVSIRSFQQVTVTSSIQYYAVAVGDFNVDGNLDIVAVANGTSNGVGVWKGDGTGSFTLLSSPDTTNQFFDVAVGDVNHDGWPDILAGGENIGPQVWLAMARVNASTRACRRADRTSVAVRTLTRRQPRYSGHDPGAASSGRRRTAPTSATFNRAAGLPRRKPTVYALCSIPAPASVSPGYRYSTNGGGSWAVTQYQLGGVTTPQTITAAGVPLIKTRARKTGSSFARPMSWAIWRSAGDQD